MGGGGKRWIKNGLKTKDISVVYIIICDSNVREKVIVEELWQRNLYLEASEFKMPPLPKSRGEKRKHAADGCDIRIIREKIG